MFIVSNLIHFYLPCFKQERRRQVEITLCTFFCTQNIVVLSPRDVQPWHFLLKIFSYRIHFEINQLSSRQCNDYLSLVNSTLHDGLLPGSLPLVDSFISSNMPNAIWINLKGRLTVNMFIIFANAKLFETNQETSREVRSFQQCLSSHLLSHFQSDLKWYLTKTGDT